MSNNLTAVMTKLDLLLALLLFIFLFCRYVLCVLLVRDGTLLRHLDTILSKLFPVSFFLSFLQGDVAVCAEAF